MPGLCRSNRDSRRQRADRVRGSQQRIEATHPEFEQRFLALRGGFRAHSSDWFG